MRSELLSQSPGQHQRIARPLWRKSLVGLVAVALVGGTGLIAGCDHGGKDAHAGAAAASQRPPAPVTTVAALAADVPVYIDQIGRTAARESVSVIPQVGGRITAVRFTEGSSVRKGDLLFEIDARPFQAALDQAEATLAQNRVKLDLAKLEWTRVEDLIQSNAVSREEYDQRRTAAIAAEAQVKWAEAAVETAKLNLEYCQIRSPIDGRTGQRLVDPGNVVKANDQTLVTIQSLDPIYADFTVTEQQFQEVRRAMTAANGGTGLLVEVALPQGRAIRSEKEQQSPAPTSASSAPESSAPRKGELTFLDNAVSSGTGTVKLRATVKNSDQLFWPGQFVNVRLILGTRHDAVLIPVTAQQIGQQGPFAYVVKQAEAVDPRTGAKQPASVAEMRVIQPGQRQGNMVVIDSGVSAGEQVITVGHMMVQPGAPVMVTNAPRPQTPAPAATQQVTNAHEHPSGADTQRH